MMKKIKLISVFALVMGFASAAVAGSYQNNVRATDDRSYSSFRIKKSDRSVQHLDFHNFSLNEGLITDGGLLQFDNTAASPSLVLVNASSGTFELQIIDGVTASVAYSLILPPGYITEGILEVKGSSETNVATGTKMAVNAVINDTTIVDLGDTAIGAEAVNEVSTAVNGLAGLVPGDKLNIVLSRNDATSGTGTLKIKSIALRFNKNIDFTE